MITQYRERVKGIIEEKKVTLNTYKDEIAEEITHTRNEVSEAAAEGDLRENAAYQSALDRLSKLSMTLAKTLSLIDSLDSYKFVENYVSTGVIGMWTTVRLKSDDSEMVIVIVPYGISDVRNNYLSAEAPIAKILMGKTAGDFIEAVNFMTKRKIKFRIEEVL